MNREPVWTVLALVALLCAGCGLPDDKTLGELDDGDRTKLCEELAKFESVTLTCGEQQLTLGPSPVSECEADFGALPTECSATVGDVRDCMEAIQVLECGDDPLDGPCGATFIDDCIASE